MKKYINIGIDIGSTTVKVVAMEKDKILYEEYRRHFSDTKKTVHDLLEEVIEKFNSYNYKITSFSFSKLFRVTICAGSNRLQKRY